MLKRIFFFLLTGALTKCPFAQSSFGVQGGGNLAYQKIEPTNKSPYSSKTFIGYFVGLSYSTNISNKLSFVPEVNFTLIGGRHRFINDNIPSYFQGEYFNNKAGYIELPLMLQYGIGKVYLTAGPAVLINVFTQTASLDYGPPYKSTDLSANIGAGYHITNRWEASLRYSHGLTNINDDPAIKAEWRNRHMRLGLRYGL